MFLIPCGSRWPCLERGPYCETGSTGIWWRRPRWCVELWELCLVLRKQRKKRRLIHRSAQTRLLSYVKISAFLCRRCLVLPSKVFYKYMDLTWTASTLQGGRRRNSRQDLKGFFLFIYFFSQICSVRNYFFNLNGRIWNPRAATILQWRKYFAQAANWMVKLCRTLFKTLNQLWRSGNVWILGQFWINWNTWSTALSPDWNDGDFDVRF